MTAPTGSQPQKHRNPTPWAQGDSAASATRITPGNALRPEDIALTAAEGTAHPSGDVAEYALRLGDDALILAQRLGQWISRGPELEEDVALGNIGLDQLGHARSFLSYAGAAWGKTEDDLAYFRREPEFRSAHLFEQPNGDFAATIARQFVAASWQYPLYRELSSSSDPMLAAIAAKAVKEVDYHLDHSTQWVLRLAGGTEESRRRMVAGLDLMWPFVGELFEDDPLTTQLGDAAVVPSSLTAEFDRTTGAVLAEAELAVPAHPMATGGGRRGRHSEHLGYLLAEMQVLARDFPGASW
ncbi:ring-1,2-phenylacetyl-CoA epoxidase subunit PaaC [Arthrobacter stackebrandtii]|uniref:Ring-1,2-phenylacetyl-CoA epoxidase subunit PaaC n=1 Tax=Arthrobacter stackebrandtii TaxID=272161 RepID=A0ABS4YWJ0_9MICC|nr:1,2-phenylacetyl-CoA epoxidase subunit PaaC [Arthrobacter stackebrandtii]MBP2413104.1 ring-1,2-phenylacetyl-CoA epoxidase subunit PaaC [Arthrobacter stackebrandtii]PYH01129.1 phenylacetate-CoA oxygenase subunit PaaI [Arthrobacter stackebrandtii]